MTDSQVQLKLLEISGDISAKMLNQNLNKSDQLDEWLKNFAKVYRELSLILSGK